MFSIILPTDSMLNHKFSILLLLVFMLASGCNRHSATENGGLIEESSINPEKAYGIVIDSLALTKYVVQKNEFLADILLRHGINYNQIDYIAKRTQDTFDVRKIIAGNNYSVIKTKDSLPQTLYFAYEISASKYVLYNFNDSVEVSIGRKSIISKTDTITGIIESSLWNAIVAQKADPNLANELSEIYAWTVDFFGLRKGDSFKIIYNKQFVEDKYVSLGQVDATLFFHGGDSLYAFYFQQNGKGDYFDENGNSLQRTFLKAPLRYNRISSRFSNSRLHPVLKIRRPHHGVDYAAASGTPVYTVGDGTVIKKGYQKRGGGNYIKIKHNGTYSTTYMHLKGFAKGIKVGDQVRQSDLIGYVGSTGLSTGPHLDFRFYKNGKPVDPLKVESPPSLPIDKSYKKAFDSVVGHYKKNL